MQTPMPKLKARLHISNPATPNTVASATFIIDASTPVEAMTIFSAAAHNIPYTGPVTNERVEDATNPNA